MSRTAVELSLGCVGTELTFHIILALITYWKPFLLFLFSLVNSSVWLPVECNNIWEVRSFASLFSQLSIISLLGYNTVVQRGSMCVRENSSNVYTGCTFSWIVKYSSIFYSFTPNKLLQILIIGMLRTCHKTTNIWSIISNHKITQTVLVWWWIIVLWECCL